MSEKDKIKAFQQEIDYIRDARIVKDAALLVSNLPDYFFEEGASSTGKYHPKYAAGKGGLLRHVKAAVKFAVELLNNSIIGKQYTSIERDLIILAIIFHDGLKYGLVKDDNYTKFDHPLLAADFIKDNANKLNMTKEEIDKVYSMIAAHMGPWNSSDYSKTELPVPNKPLEKFVHMCDYLASRRFINVDFDQDNNIIDESK